MSNQKHTPGPWHVEMNDNYMRLYMPASGLEGDVARGYVGESTARLIAAAPELLAALEGLVNFVANSGMEFGRVTKVKWLEAYEPMNAARDAIRVAKGESK